jgi:hypothetical protein
VAQLLFCETVTALALLRQKGSFILKTFTTLEHHTVCLLYIINCCFSEVHAHIASLKAYSPLGFTVFRGWEHRDVISHPLNFKSAQ